MALLTLGYSDTKLAPFLKPAGDVALAARLFVDYGPAARYAYRYWVLHQGLVSALYNSPPPGRPFCRSLISEMLDRATSLTSDSQVPDALAEFYHRCASTGRLSRSEADEIRADLLTTIEALMDEATGCTDNFFVCSTTDADVTYEEVYRLCRIAGHIAGIGPLLGARVIERDDLLHRRHELHFALERLRFPKFLPRFLTQAHEAVSLLPQPSRRLRPEHLAEITQWLDSFLAVYYGHLAPVVFWLSRDFEFLRRCTRLDGPTADLCHTALHAISSHLRTLDLSSSQRASALAARLAPNTGIPANTRRQISQFSDSAEERFVHLFPSAVRTRIGQAGLALAAMKLTGYRIPVDEARVDAFISQFKPSQRWIPEGLVAILDHYDQGFFARTLSKTMEVVQAGTRATVCVFGGSGKSSSFMTYLLDRKLHVKHRELRDILASGARGLEIVFLDDCCISGTQAIHILQEMYFPSGASFNYVAPLDSRSLTRLRRIPFTLVFALGTNGGLCRVRKWITDKELRGRVVAGREFPLLSMKGMQDLEEGTLYGPDKVLTAPEEQLTFPLFVAGSRAWGDNDPSTAQSVCENVGYQLLEARAAEKGWTDVRRTASALGYSRLQLLTTFDHNVPKSTLTLLWETGMVNGRQWLPLLPTRD
jgi:hypothetical protein